MDGADARILGAAKWRSRGAAEGEVDAAVPFGARPQEGSIVTVNGRPCRIVRVGPFSSFPDIYLEPGEIPVHLTIEPMD